MDKKFVYNFTVQWFHQINYSSLSQKKLIHSLDRQNKTKNLRSLSAVEAKTSKIGQSNQKHARDNTS